MKPYVALALLLTTTACVQKSKYTEAIAQNDSLLVENLEAKKQFNEMLQLVNEVEANFEEIKERENYLNIESNSELNSHVSIREKLMTDIDLVAKTLIENKKKIATLESKLQSSGELSTQLQRTIDRLKESNSRYQSTIVELTNELALRNAKIASLNKDVEQLHSTVEILNTTSQEQQSQIEQQSSEMNRVWYTYGTKGELKREGIITGGTLFKAMKLNSDSISNTHYFIEADRRTLTEIPLHDKQAKLLSTHPADTYTLTPDADGELTLVITDAEFFWSLTPYLVIVVD